MVIVKKIIAGINPLPTLTYSDKVKQILRDKYGWVGSVEDLAKENGFDWENTESSARTVFRKWHQSITTKMFSLEDMYGLKDLLQKTSPLMFESATREYIKSLQQPIQLNVEVKMENDYEEPQGDYLRPKIINNSILITKIL